MVFFQAVVLEGKYWKRRLESVTAEYKRWRTFFKEKLHRGVGGVGGGHPSSLGMSMQEVGTDGLSLVCTPLLHPSHAGSRASSIRYCTTRKKAARPKLQNRTGFDFPRGTGAYAPRFCCWPLDFLGAQYSIYFNQKSCFDPYFYQKTFFMALSLKSNWQTLQKKFTGPLPLLLKMHSRVGLGIKILSREPNCIL